MKLYLIAGKSGHGKDTLGNYLKHEYEKNGQKACILHIASPLYDFARNHFGWNGDKESRPREFFQQMGVEIIHKKLKRTHFLIDRLTEDISILKHFFDVGIITDGRLISEFNELNLRFPNIKIIYIERPNYENSLNVEEQNHITECQFETYLEYDYNVINISLEELENSAKRIVKLERRKDRELGE